MKNTKLLMTDFYWLVASLFLTVCLVAAFFGQPFSSRGVDIHIHDSFFVFPRLLIFLQIFSLTSFLVFFIREKKNAFPRRNANRIILISAFVLFASLTGLQNSISPEITHPAAKVLSGIIILFQFIIVILLIYFMYRWMVRRE